MVNNSMYITRRLQLYAYSLLRPLLYNINIEYTFMRNKVMIVIQQIWGRDKMTAVYWLWLHFYPKFPEICFRDPINSKPHRFRQWWKDAMLLFELMVVAWFIERLGSSLQWRHNGRDSVSNHQPLHCLLNRLFRRRSKKTSKLRVTGLCAGNSPGTGEFPAQMASYAENVSIWWRHHDRTISKKS